jgi:hypothetical protein
VAFHHSLPKKLERDDFALNRKDFQGTAICMAATVIFWLYQ